MSEREIERLVNKLIKEMSKKFVLIKLEDWVKLQADIADMRNMLSLKMSNERYDEYSGTRDDFRFMGEDC